MLDDKLVVLFLAFLAMMLVVLLLGGLVLLFQLCKFDKVLRVIENLYSDIEEEDLEEEKNKIEE